MSGNKNTFRRVHYNYATGSSFIFLGLNEHCEITEQDLFSLKDIVMFSEISGIEIPLEVRVEAAEEIMRRLSSSGSNLRGYPVFVPFWKKMAEATVNEDFRNFLKTNEVAEQGIFSFPDGYYQWDYALTIFKQAKP